jgi:hypothetical protein
MVSVQHASEIAALRESVQLASILLKSGGS